MGDSRFSEITGLDLNDLFRAKSAPTNTDRGIMMLAFRCLYQDVIMTKDEQSLLREAYRRMGIL